MSDEFYGYSNIESRIVYLEFFDSATLADFLEEEERENLGNMREWDCFDIPSLANVLKNHVETCLEESCHGFGLRIALTYVSRVNFADIAENLICYHLDCLPIDLASYRRKSKKRKY